MEKCKDHDHHDHKHIDKQQKINYSHTNGTAAGVSTAVDDTVTTSSSSVPQETEHKQTKNSRREKNKEQDKERETVEYIQRLESDSKKLRADLQSSRASEQELRIQVGLFFQNFLIYLNSLDVLAYI